MTSSGDYEVLHDDLNPSGELIGLNTAGEILMTEQERSGAGGKRYRLIAYPSTTKSSDVPETRYEFSIPEGRSGKFIVSPDGDTIVYQIDGDGVYKVVSDSTSAFSVTEFGEIGYVSNQGKFLVTHSRFGSASSRILVIEPKTGDVM